MIPDTLNIKNYINDGFVKFCDVELMNKVTNQWQYRSVNTTLVNSDHRSWVYCIVDDEEIVKVGETGNLLCRMPYVAPHEHHALPGTTTRLGRLANHNSGVTDTDYWIRRQLQLAVMNKKVSIWVKECKLVSVTETCMGKETQLNSTTHKLQEKLYLTTISESTGSLPRLNCCHK